MTVYKAIHSQDVWAMSTVGGETPELVATTTQVGPDDLDGVFAWMAEFVGQPLGALISVGAHTKDGEAMYVGTNESEFVAVVAEEIR